MENSVILVLDEDVRLSCERKLLCKASPYFNAMFSERYVESEKHEIRLHGIGQDAMEKLIVYAESNSSKVWSDLGVDNENVVNILQAAGMLQFEEVRKFCCEYILNDLALSTNNALQILGKIKNILSMI